MPSELISLCLATRHRPALLLECLSTLTRQAYRPLEIVIGDNSTDDHTERALASVVLPDGVTLVYHRHQPATEEPATNWTWTAHRATGTRLMLMHDDDLLCDGGLDRLVAAWDRAPPDVAAVYGKAEVVTFAGDLEPAETERINRLQLRTPDRAGVQRSNALAGITQQFPTNGWLADAALVKQCGWRTRPIIGIWADVDFSIRFAELAGSRPFVFLDEFVSKTRLGETRLSGSRSTDVGSRHFLEQVRSFRFPPECHEHRDWLLRTLTEMGVVEAAREGERARALALLRSEHYRHSWLVPFTLYRLLYIASPAMAQACNRVFRRLPV